MLPSPSQLTYFLEVANTLNISRAGERLGVSQPSLSLAIQKLEHSLGVALIVRLKNGIRLTKHGQEFSTEARELLQHWESIREKTDKREKEIIGTYSIGSHPSLGNYTFPLFIPQLMEKYPDLKFNFEFDLSRVITEKIVSFKLDYGVVVNPVEHPDLVIRQVGRDEVTLWTAKKKSPLQDPFSGEAVLIGDQKLAQSQYLVNQIKKKKIKIKRIIETSNLEVITTLVSKGGGIGILPGRVAKRNTSLCLRPLMADFPSFTDKICLIYRSDAQVNPSSKMLLKDIENCLKDQLD